MTDDLKQRAADRAEKWYSGEIDVSLRKRLVAGLTEELLAFAQSIQQETLAAAAQYVRSCRETLNPDCVQVYDVMADHIVRALAPDQKAAAPPDDDPDFTPEELAVIKANYDTGLKQRVVAAAQREREIRIEELEAYLGDHEKTCKCGFCKRLEMLKAGRIAQLQAQPVPATEEGK